MSIFAEFFAETAAAQQATQRRSTYISSRYTDADYVESVGRNSAAQADQRDICRQTLDTLNNVLEYLERVEQRCAYCNEPYFPSNNYGQYRCCWHPDNSATTKRHLCCDQPVGSRGCQRCDHTAEFPVDGDRWPSSVRVEKLPYILMHRFHIPPTACSQHPHTDPKHSYVLVRRTQEHQ